MLQSFQRVSLLSIALALLCLFITPLVNSQECLPPVQLPSSTETNYFVDEKEVYLGDAIAEHIQKNYRVIEDPAVTEYLTQIGTRLSKNLPLTKLRFQFLLVELPNANAFVIPGGRIYVSRKLIALAQSEDELAGVIAHEMGHLVTHESAINLTRLMKSVLNVTGVGNRQDIFDKYNELIENVRRKPEAFRTRDRESGQLAADQSGLYALIKSGYDPSALTRFWDRATETKGKTGSWLSDVFGTTRPEERRLREMIKTVSALPAECRQSRIAEQPERFKEWQQLVIGYTGLGRRESLHGLVAKQQLSPPLRSDISRLRFSPDGNYILAQDDSGISILSREPFAPLFRIETDDSKPAQFSPDSKSVVFSNENLRVSKWSISDQKVTSTHELVIRKGCLQTSLSADGKFLACLKGDMSLAVLEVESGQTVIERKEFVIPTFYQLWMLFAAISQNRLENADAGLHWVNMDFSPDSHYFVAGYMGLDTINRSIEFETVVGFDLTTSKQISLGDSVKRSIVGGFTFMTPDKIAGINYQDYKKSGVFSFPDGKPISGFTARGNLEAATLGDYLFVRPIKDFPVGMLDLKTNVISKSNKQPAIDIYGELLVAEMRNGELGLYRVEKNQLIASTLLTNINLGSLRVAELSADMKWISLSGRSRGGVWNLGNGEASLYLRGFSGGYLTSDGYFFGDFPKYETAERNVAKFNLRTGEVTPGATIMAGSAIQAGPFVIISKSAKANAKDDEIPREWKNITYEILDATNLSPLWSRTFPKEAARFRVAPQHNTGVFILPVNSDAAKNEIKSDPKLNQQLAAMKEKEGDYFIEVVEMQKGQTLGKLLIETGKASFRFSSVYAAGDYLVATDDQNRVLVYSIKTGVQIGRVFGGYAAVSVESGLLCVENEVGKIAIYNLNNLERKDELIFSSPISMIRFNSEGKKLLVLTSNQQVHVFDVAALNQSASTSQR